MILFKLPLLFACFNLSYDSLSCVESRLSVYRYSFPPSFKDSECFLHMWYLYQGSSIVYVFLWINFIVDDRWWLELPISVKYLNEWRSEFQNWERTLRSFLTVRIDLFYLFFLYLRSTRNSQTPCFCLDVGQRKWRIPMRDYFSSL